MRNLLELLQSFQGRILVVGDVMLDIYVWGHCNKLSKEVPVPCLQETRRDLGPGGAANVANIVRHLGPKVRVSGLSANDQEGRTLRNILSSSGVEIHKLLVDPDRITTTKTRFMGLAQQSHPQQMLRLDRETTFEMSSEIEGQLIDKIVPEIYSSKAVLVSDYAKGTASPRVISSIRKRCTRHGVPLIIDPAVGRYFSYQQTYAITPNRLEASQACDLSIESVKDAAKAAKILRESLDLQYVFITLDKDGILASWDGGFEHFPTKPRNVYDISGAGDMVLAMLGAGFAAGGKLEEIVQLANIAGGIEVEKIGAKPVTRQEIAAELFSMDKSGKEKICTPEEIDRYVAARRQLGQRVVFSNGCFDVLHIGHMHYLAEAAKKGDCLIVGINDDIGVNRAKGSGRPVFNLHERSAALAALSCVDYVVPFTEDNPIDLLQQIKPDVLVKGHPYTLDGVVGKETVENYGGKVEVVSSPYDVSTTDILDRLSKDSKCRV